MCLHASLCPKYLWAGHRGSKCTTGRMCLCCFFLMIRWSETLICDCMQLWLCVLMHAQDSMVYSRAPAWVLLLLVSLAKSHWLLQILLSGLFCAWQKNETPSSTSDTVVCYLHIAHSSLWSSEAVEDDVVFSNQNLKAVCRFVCASQCVSSLWQLSFNACPDTSNGWCKCLILVHVIVQMCVQAMCVQLLASALWQMQAATVTHLSEVTWQHHAPTL